MNDSPPKRIGVIDIGSNTVRLVVYEMSDSGAHLTIDEGRDPVRLSARLDEHGILRRGDIERLCDTLYHFTLLCTVNEVQVIRAVATAAFRQMKNVTEVLNRIREHTALDVEVLSGEAEAHLGFLGVINSVDIRDGFIVDIGGGSTEVTLFQERKVVNSVSFPFGSVNTAHKFSSVQRLSDLRIEINKVVDSAIAEQPWICEHPKLPLIGLGGTIRSVCKMDQREQRYSFPLTHNYTLPGENAEHLLAGLTQKSERQRRKIQGLSSDRSDIIVPGIMILTRIFEKMNSSHYVISGAGLRDGLLFETIHPNQPLVDNILEYSVQKLLSRHPAVPEMHIKQVARIADKLYQDMRLDETYDSRSRIYLQTAAMLYRIGVSIHYYDFDKHTYYLMIHSRIDGLSHREILICALIASFKSRGRTRKFFREHPDILKPEDLQLAIKLGSLLRLSIALDRSETQTIRSLQGKILNHKLIIQVQHRYSLHIEQKALADVREEFQKNWLLQPFMTSQQRN